MRGFLIQSLLLTAVVSSQAVVNQNYFISDFSAGQLPLVDESTAVNGSWHGDIYQSGAGFQEVGGLGVATGSGLAYSETFGPVDITQGFGSLGTHQRTITEQTPNPYYDSSRPPGIFNEPYITTSRTFNFTLWAGVYLFAAAAESPQSLRLTLYDAAGGSSYWDVLLDAPAGQFVTRSATDANFVGDLDWSQVNRFSLSGPGGDQPFHAAFHELAVMPEPGATGLVAAGALLALAIYRRRQGKHE